MDTMTALKAFHHMQSPTDKESVSKRDRHGRFAGGPPSHGFQPGQSGNPKGRPPLQKSLTSLLRLEIDTPCPDDREGRTWRELLVLSLMRLAMKGHPTALKEVWDRIDGKVPLRMNEEQGPLEIIVTYDR